MARRRRSLPSRFTPRSRRSSPTRRARSRCTRSLFRASTGSSTSSSTSGVVRSSQHNHEPCEYAIDRMHREAHPSISIAQFRHGLERMATDRRYEPIRDAGYPMLFIPGYCLAIDFARNCVVAHARHDDPHLGTTSKYALARGTHERKAVASRARDARTGDRPAPSRRRMRSGRPDATERTDAGRQGGMTKLSDLLQNAMTRSKPTDQS